MHVAIVGAGLSGLAAAYSLRDTDTRVSIFEKSRGVSGRAATRRRGDVCYDHGANHFKTKTDRIERLVREELSTDGLAEIEGDVWTFDAEGALSEGDPEKNAEAKWTYRDGVSRLGKHLADAAGVEPQFRTRVSLLARDEERGQWTLTDTDEQTHGPFDAVLLTPPAPQTADLLQAARFDDALQARLVDALAPATYRTQLTLVLAYRRRVERPPGCYALLGPGEAHPIAWLGFEDEKPGHVPDGDATDSLLIVQMGPSWSRPRFRSELDALVPEAAALAGDVLGEDLSRPLWADKQGWRYALPEAAADTNVLDEGAEVGLFFTGDAVKGSGRIGQALEAGLEAGGRLRAAS